MYLFKKAWNQNFCLFVNVLIVRYCTKQPNFYILQMAPEALTVNQLGIAVFPRTSIFALRVDDDFSYISMPFLHWACTLSYAWGWKKRLKYLKNPRVYHPYTRKILSGICVSAHPFFFPPHKSNFLLSLTYQLAVKTCHNSRTYS